jgi:hypothetical protein
MRPLCLLFVLVVPTTALAGTVDVVAGTGKPGYSGELSHHRLEAGGFDSRLQVRLRPAHVIRHRP